MISLLQGKINQTERISKWTWKWHSQSGIQQWKFFLTPIATRSVSKSVQNPPTSFTSSLSTMLQAPSGGLAPAGETSLTDNANTSLLPDSKAANTDIPNSTISRPESWPMPKLKSNKPKRNIWTDPSGYGTYEGEPGNPNQWKNSFHFAWESWDKTKATEIVKEESPYTILGITELTSLEEIKKAFRKLILIHHPDKGGSEELCKKIIAAYVILTN